MQVFALAGWLPSAVLYFAFITLFTIHLEGLGLTGRDIGLLTMMFPLTRRCLGPVSGLLNSAWGARWGIRIGFLLSLAGYLFFCFARSRAEFALALTIIGFGSSLHDTGLAMLLTVPSASRDAGNRYLAIHYVLVNAAASVGAPLAALVLDGRWSLSTFLTLAGIGATTFGVLSIGLIPRSADRQRGQPERFFRAALGVLRNHHFRVLVLSLPAIWWLFETLRVALPLYLLRGMHVPRALIPSVYLVNAVVVLILGYPVNRMLVRLCERRQRSKVDALALAAVLMGGSFLLLLTDAWFGQKCIYLFAFAFTCGEICFISMVRVLVNDYMPSASTMRSVYFGVASFSSGLGSAGSHVLGGMLIDTLGASLRAVFPILMGCMGLLIGIGYWLVSNRLSAAPSR